MRLYAVTLLLVLPAAAAEWKLVWSDEFDKSGSPDPSRWTFEEGFIRNQEEQLYRRQNARVENGRLVIEARKEEVRNPAYAPGSTDWRTSRQTAGYTSASLTTQGKASWTYGRIEVSARLPGGRGTWPAIWMLGVDKQAAGWPACGEIDIMENVGFEPDVIHANVHTEAYNHVAGTAKGDKITVSHPSKFHNYAVEWHPDRMDFFVDEKLYFTFANEKTGGKVWPFDKPAYLILNLAIGGAWGGRHGIDPAVFPQRYEIDYVRVYAAAESR